jgi:PAS domain S-box-containing protein
LQGADFGNIQLYDRETGALEIVAHRGFDQEFLEYFSDTDENAACGRAMKRGERVVIEDVENDVEFEPHRRIAASAGFRAVQCTPLFDRNGELLGMLSTHFRQPHRPSERELRMTDLYARQAAEIIGAKGVEEALRENEEWLRLAEWAARSGTWEWDLASGEIRWSNQHRELFGFDSEGPITREGWFAIVHPDDLSSIDEAGRRCLEEDAEWPEVIEYRIRRGAETRWISARGRTVKDDTGHPVRILGISVDVTDRKRAGEERERLLARELTARAQSEERRRLSRELHDRVAHDIALVHQSLELHEALKERNPEKSAAKLELARKATKEALESTRNLSMELRRPEVSRGLEAALSDLPARRGPPEHQLRGLGGGRRDAGAHRGSRPGVPDPARGDPQRRGALGVQPHNGAAASPAGRDGGLRRGRRRRFPHPCSTPGRPQWPQVHGGTRLASGRDPRCLLHPGEGHDGPGDHTTGRA